jgi:hypothetical protein
MIGAKAAQPTTPNKKANRGLESVWCGGLPKPVGLRSVEDAAIRPGRVYDYGWVLPGSATRTTPSAPGAGIAARSQQGAEMGKPILLLVNQPGRVLDALAGDLARCFGPIMTSSPNCRRRRWRHLKSSRQGRRSPTHRGPADAGRCPGSTSWCPWTAPTAKRVLLVGRREWMATNPAFGGDRHSGGPSGSRDQGAPGTAGDGSVIGP